MVTTLVPLNPEFHNATAVVSFPVVQSSIMPLLTFVNAPEVCACTTPTMVGVMLELIAIGTVNVIRVIVFDAFVNVTSSIVIPA